MAEVEKNAGNFENSRYCSAGFKRALALKRVLRISFSDAVRHAGRGRLDSFQSGLFRQTIIFGANMATPRRSRNFFSGKNIHNTAVIQSGKIKDLEALDRILAR